LNIASQSGSSQSSAASVFAVDRQLRDMKLHITENREPQQIILLRRVLAFMLLFLTLSATLTFAWHLEEGVRHSGTMRSALRALEMQGKFVQLQMNLRTLVDVASHPESNRGPVFDEVYGTRDRRVQYL
jgi:hypothetical protein